MQTLGRARRVRVYDQRGRIDAVPKRRDREPSSLLADVTADDLLTTLATALRVRSDSEIMCWMGWPDRWFEFVDDQGSPLVTLGLLAPDWLRWGPYGDLRLVEPDALTAWLTATTG